VQVVAQARERDDVLARSSITEWKYTNGSWRVAYWSTGVASCVMSVAPIAGCPQVALSRAGSLPMSCM
jgi:hypothetical protein